MNSQAFEFESAMNFNARFRERKSESFEDKSSKQRSLNLLTPSNIRKVTEDKDRERTI